MITAEQLAQAFHEAYERLAPDFGYKTREASAVAWPEVPKQNRQLMIAVAATLLAGPLAPTPVAMGGANVHTYFRRPKRVQAYLYQGEGTNDAEELNALLHRDGDVVTYSLTNEEGDFLMEEGIEPGQWLCVDTATGEQYVVEDAEFRREYLSAREV